MDQRKALFRAKLRESEQKKDKRIDSPLVRYNEHGQPICRVCNITLKSESLWSAHQVSRKHHEAIENLKAAAAGVKKGSGENQNKNKKEQPTEFQKTQSSSTVPANFFDNKETKRQKIDANSISASESSQAKKEPAPLIDRPIKISDSSNRKLDIETDKTNQNENGKIQPPKESSNNNKAATVKRAAVPDGFFDTDKESGESARVSQLVKPVKSVSSEESKQGVKGVLPEGFFDNRDADLRARGIQPVKVDINDAYKEFEKEIQDDLQDVDNRLEEEEIDAAEEQEEFLTLEQMEYREKVDMVKQKLIEVKATRFARANQKPVFESKESSDDDSSGDDDSADDSSFAVDWRAQHL